MISYQFLCGKANKLGVDGRPGREALLLEYACMNSFSYGPKLTTPICSFNN